MAHWRTATFEIVAHLFYHVIWFVISFYINNSPLFRPKIISFLSFFIFNNLIMTTKVHIHEFVCCLVDWHVFCVDLFFLLLLLLLPRLFVISFESDRGHHWPTAYLLLEFFFHRFFFGSSFRFRSFSFPLPTSQSALVLLILIRVRREVFLFRQMKCL